MRHPLYVAFVWHMHQPYYLDEGSGELLLPWVRLHATKDYLHMAEVIEDYPQVHATFNFVPSLVEQLQGYVDGTSSDRAWRVSLKEKLTREDKEFVDNLFYSVNRDNFIRSYPRYWQLLRLKEEAGGDLDLLGELYWRDLVAWFNLAWIDPSWIQRDPELRALVAKGSHFSLEDVSVILGKHRELMGATLTAFRHLQRRGQVELIVSPYYHPILPLLIDSNCAQEPSPWLQLPTERFVQRDDAMEQLRRAIAHHEGVFEKPPSGLWPSEGSVSQSLIDLLGGIPEIRWLATDEAILARSLGQNIERNGWGYLSDPRFLYQPYGVQAGDRRVAMVFRDHYLSDRIGFAYQGMTGRQAAEDLMFRFVAIHEMVKDDPEPYLVPIILDGENCWEYYEKNGETFLRALYEMMSNQDRVRAVTVSEYLNEFPVRREIPRLATGSWINGNLETWIGEDTQNRGWEYLYRTRAALAEAESRDDIPDLKLQRARRSMMAAEGSDWFWWYYSHNVSDQDAMFDELYRNFLAGVYRALDRPVPDWISIPIITQVPKLTSRKPRGYIRPQLSKTDLSPAPWDLAGYLEPKGSTGAMQQGSGLLKRLYFGYDDSKLYLRLDCHSSLAGYIVELYMSHLEGISSVEGGEPSQGAEIRASAAAASRDLSIDAAARSAGLSLWQEGSGWLGIDGKLLLMVTENVVELAVPLEQLGVGLGARLGLSVVLFREGLVVQRLPEEGEVVVDLALVELE
ncbi:MAG TPA: glycoside hydrolase family 57 protein [Chloroflexota bacterium]|nr:glycoside hydrolase family 57 protein [Chloroflexota bacterium]